jgi:hypothetical protein
MLVCLQMPINDADITQALAPLPAADRLALLRVANSLTPLEKSNIHPEELLKYLQGNKQGMAWQPPRVGARSQGCVVG